MRFITQKNDLAKDELKALGENIKQIDDKTFLGEVYCYERLAYTKQVYFKNKSSWVNKEKFNDRKSHLRPAPSGHSLDPRLARVLVNLTGIKRGILLDPFCGSSGFLIEAGLIGLKYAGSDIDKKNIENSKINLKHFKLPLNVKVQDALTITKPFSYLVTDLPYGRASKISKELKELYSDFALLLSKKLKKRAVVVSPDFMDFSLFAKKHKSLKVKKTYDLYVHKSLTRKICVIERV